MSFSDDRLGLTSLFCCQCPAAADLLFRQGDLLLVCRYRVSCAGISDHFEEVPEEGVNPVGLSLEGVKVSQRTSQDGAC